VEEESKKSKVIHLWTPLKKDGKKKQGGSLCGWRLKKNVSKKQWWDRNPNFIKERASVEKALKTVEGLGRGEEN